MAFSMDCIDWRNWGSRIIGDYVDRSPYWEPNHTESIPSRTSCILLLVFIPFNRTKKQDLKCALRQKTHEKQKQMNKFNKLLNLIIRNENTIWCNSERRAEVGMDTDKCPNTTHVRWFTNIKINWKNLNWGRDHHS